MEIRELCSVSEGRRGGGASFCLQGSTSAGSCTDLASRAEALFELGAEQQARWQELHEWLRGSWRMCAVGVPMGPADAGDASARNTNLDVVHK